MHEYVIEAEGKQWGAGQGGFFTQSIKFTKANETDVVLRFVYDCGTKSSRAELHTAIREYAQGLPQHSMIDAVFISHIDEDHVNGLEMLAAELKLRGVRISKIVLPPLSDLVAFVLAATATGSGAWREFARNPAGRLREWFGEDQRILFLTDANGNADDQDITVDNLDNANSSIQKVDISNGGVRAMYVDGANSRATAIWEIVPFVQPEVVDDKEGLRTFLGDKLSSDAFRWFHEDGFFIVPFEDRKKIREGVARWSWGNVNSASLVLYSGSARSSDTYMIRLEFPAGARDHVLVQSLLNRTARTGWLGTGDAELSDRNRGPDALRQLQAFFGTRLDRLLVVNAPHHGSEASSGEAFWDATRPDVAVFNASGKHYNHPSAAVVKLALTYAAVALQTRDSTSAFTFRLVRA